MSLSSIFAEEFALVGQNMYMTSVNSESVTKDDLMRAVEAWYEEIIYTTANIIKSYTQCERLMV